MKRFTKFLVLVAFFAFAVPMVVSAQQISVYVDGARVDFPDQQPVIIDGRTLVPVRGAFEMLGFEVEWETDVITIIDSRFDLSRIPMSDQERQQERQEWAEEWTERGIIGAVTLRSAEYEIIMEVWREYFITETDQLRPMFIRRSVHDPVMGGLPVITRPGRRIYLEVPPQIINGRVMMPIRPLAEAVGARVGWDGSTQAITITSGDFDFYTEFVAYSPGRYISRYELAFNDTEFLSAFHALVQVTPPDGILQTEYVIFRQVNFVRVHFGLRPLIWDASLGNAARAFVEDRAAFADTNPTSRAQEAGWTGGAVSWNEHHDQLAVIVSTWLFSAGTLRNNLLNPSITHAGVGGVEWLDADDIMRANVQMKFGTR